MAWFWRAARVGLVVYGAICGALYIFQRRLIFPAPPAGEPPAYAPCTLVRIPGENGVLGAGMYAAPTTDGAPTVIYMHGNAEDLRHSADIAQAITAGGLGFLALEYPGYGELAEQSASEKGIYAAAQAAVDWLLAKGVPRKRVMVIGRSLGSGPAVELAKRGLVERMVLISPYTSIIAMARKMMPFAPASLLVKDRFESDRKAPRIEIPVLVIHAVQDEIIPVAMGRRMAELFPQAKLELLEGFGHNDLPLRRGTPLMEQIVAFLKN